MAGQGTEPGKGSEARRRTQADGVTVSCVIPTYNYGRYVAAAVESVLAVLREGDQCIVVDDGSTDDTRQRLGKPRIRGGGGVEYVYQPNAGPGAARNAGARLAKGDYLYFLDADDKVIAEGFRKLRAVVERHEGVGMVFGNHITVTGGAKRRAGRPAVLTADRERNFVDCVIRRRFSIRQGALLIRRDLASAYPYREDLRASEGQPVHAWLLANEQALAIPDPVLEFAMHEDSVRHQLEGYAEVVERLPDIIFDRNKLPAPLLKWKRRFRCNQLLSLFRAQYLAGERQAAKRSYLRALRAHPPNLLKLPYLAKFLRLLFGRG